MKKNIAVIGAALALFSACSGASSTQESPLASKETLTKAEVAEYASFLAKEWKENVKEQWDAQFQAGSLQMAGKTMPIWWTTFGEKPADGHSLYISLHGGGGAPASLNDQQWDNQKRLYRPAEGVYLCPRAITNTWDLHFVPEADAFYEAIIRYAVAAWDVNPDKVYLMGYSAGGDGVWRLAPRMADHWAAASMMAGHPGDVSLESLRNTPFMIWCGALDDAYQRNAECAARIEEMDRLQAADPEGYVHEGHIVEGKGHWMDGVDAAAVPWMASKKRNPYPDRVVWKQGDVMKTHFYWLGAPKEELSKGKQAVVSVKDNVVTIESCDYNALTVFLNDDLVDLDRTVWVKADGRLLYEGIPERRSATMRETLEERGDLSYIFPVAIPLTL